MIVMPFKVFKEQGKIEKSTLEWRTKAFDNGWLVQYTGDLVVIFISHRWWYHPPNRPAGTYDWGGPDHVEGHKANLKWRLICEGVDALIKKDNLQVDKVALWIDWQVLAHAFFLPCMSCSSARNRSSLPSVRGGSPSTKMIRR